MGDAAIEAIHAYNDSLVDQHGQRTDLAGSITVTIYRGGGGGFSSNGTMSFSCGMVGYETKIVNLSDFTEDELKRVKDILLCAIARSDVRRKTESK